MSEDIDDLIDRLKARLFAARRKESVAVDPAGLRQVINEVERLQSETVALRAAALAHVKSENAARARASYAEGRLEAATLMVSVYADLRKKDNAIIRDLRITARGSYTRPGDDPDAVRAAIPDEFILVPPDGGDVTTVDAIKAMVEKIAEFERLFAMTFDASMRGIKKWQAAGSGRELTWPDKADLVAWLLERLTVAEAAVEGLPANKRPFADALAQRVIEAQIKELDRMAGELKKLRFGEGAQ